MDELFIALYIERYDGSEVVNGQMVLDTINFSSSRAISISVRAALPTALA